MYSYDLQNGTTVLSPNNLDYALRYDLTLDTHKVLTEHRKEVRKPDPLAADVILSMEKIKAMYSDQTSRISGNLGIIYATSVCVRSKSGTLYIHDGTYRPLKELLESGNQKVKKFVINKLAIQICLCNEGLQMIAPEKVPLQPKCSLINDKVCVCNHGVYAPLSSQIREASVEDRLGEFAMELAVAAADARRTLDQATREWSAA